MQTSLCYLEKDNQYLMLHRIKKENDINHGKWIGVGGKFEHNESPEECMIREVKEETNLDVLGYRYRGIITFAYNNDETLYMHLFTADAFIGEISECSEGILKWVDIDKVTDLELWEGDLIFLELLQKNEPFFSLKLVYHDDVLIEAYLNNERVNYDKK